MLRALALLAIALSPHVQCQSSDTCADASCPAISPDCPVPLLSVVDVSGRANDGKNHSFQLLEQGLKYLEAQPAPLYIVPILGVYRGGKSLLLNRCFGLRAPYTNGFGVAHTQDTFTRGIQMCSEHVDGLGTVVWMDTEGLFSSEYLQGQYGPQLFSLALLFSSVVMLNSVKQLSSQFVDFFSQQQRIARVLRNGLEAHNLSKSDFLPRDLSIIWLLSQPIDNSWTPFSRQLNNFLSASAEAKNIRDEFKHHSHLVPIATNDARAFSKLDTLTDEQLLPEYIASVKDLRKKVLDLLVSARPMHPGSVVKQLRMYAQLVQSEQFNDGLFMEALENNRLHARCNEYEMMVREAIKKWPSAAFKTAMENADKEAAHIVKTDMEEFQFSGSWGRRLRSCMDAKRIEVERGIDDQLLEVFKGKASKMAESAECYFVDALMVERNALWASHNRAVDYRVSNFTVVHATALQRAKLSECLKVRDVLEPFLPLLLCPLAYLFYGCLVRLGLFSGLFVFLFLTVGLAGLHSSARLLNLVPQWFSFDWSLLREFPKLWGIVMPIMRWFPRTVSSASAATWYISCLVPIWTSFKLLRNLWDNLLRPAGDQVSGMVGLELKLNVLRRRLEITAQQQLLQCLQDAGVSANKGDDCATATSLFRALCLLRGTDGQDFELQAWADAATRRRATKLLDKADVSTHKGVSAAFAKTIAINLAFKGDWSGTIVRVVEVLEHN